MEKKSKNEPNWLIWAKKLQAIAQSGVTYSKDPFDQERYQKIFEISSEILAKKADLSGNELLLLLKSQKGYPTPKVDLRAAVFKANKILMVKEKDTGKWSLPGGWADIDKSLSENIENEVWEESGLEVTAQKIIAILFWNRRCESNLPFSIYKIVVSCTSSGGSFRKNLETSAANFFPLQSLPKLCKARVDKNILKMCFEHKKNRMDVIFD